MSRLAAFTSRFSVHFSNVTLIVGLLGIAAPVGAQLPAPTDTKPAPTAPRTKIELPLAERQAMERPTENRPATVTKEDLVPSAADQAAAQPDDRGPRIEQRRTSNRVSEIKVTPAGSSYSYLITNREGRQPTSITDLSSGLSIPKFFSFDFGRPTTNPATPPPPPSR